MKNAIQFLILSLALALCFNAEGQVVGKYLEKKLKQATNRAVDKADEEVTEEMNKKVDREVEKAFDKITGEDEETTGDTSTSPETSSQKSGTPSSGTRSSDAASKAMLKSMGINTAPANVKENYNYSGNILMKVETWNEKGKTDGEVNYTTYMTSDNSGFAMEFDKEGERSLMIFDYANGVMVILAENNNEKTGIVTPYASYLTDSLQNIDSEANQEGIEDYSAINQNLKKTGRSKNIAGYSCDEYTSEDEETEVVLWMTNELPSELWANMFSANVITASSVGYYGGFVMEMEQKEKASDEKVFMQVQEVNRDQARSISTKGYQLISFGGNTP